jgi:hypothetical protein
VRGQWAVWPPSTTYTPPVANEANGEEQDDADDFFWLGGTAEL